VSDLQIFGVRHHGPGCARSLVRALEEWQPDCVLIEGPPEADALLPLAIADGMEPPVALLLYASENPKRAAFYPFAEFSPEWQAIRYAVKNAVPVRFMDLPQAHQLTPAAEETPEADSDGQEAGLRRDPLGWLGEAAGYGGGEEWWEHMVEQRRDGAELFAAIAEAMAAVRAETPPDKREERREMQREAHMRKTIRAARKDGHARIAVICGAWHVPALTQMPPVGADNELLKNLPKTKVEATWVPWTYGRLASESGYGAGVISPAWYEHLWRRGGQADSARWFARVARLLRGADLDCSSAHIIECVRLSEALAAVRERPLPGLAELMEAAKAVLTTGEDAPLRLIQRDLIIGQKLGKVAAGVPTVPLQRDLEKQQKSLRMKVSATQEMLELDLRKENDLARSRLLHRLSLLGIPWGNVAESRGGKGTFREVWKLQWMPEFAISLIEAAPYGNSMESAAGEFSIKTAREAKALPVLTELIPNILFADLPQALTPVMHELENRAAVTGDILQLMAAVPPLAKVSRYGDVRQTDTSQVLHILNSLILRISIGLHPACQSLDDDAAEEMAGKIGELHSAIELASQPEHLTMWLPSLSRLADAAGVHSRIRGIAARILFDAKHCSTDETSGRMSYALSRGENPESAAAWLEGFLSSSGMVLVYDDALFHILNAWVAGLSAEHFTQVLPLVRRTFSTFPPMERRQIGEKAHRSREGGASAPASPSPASEWDHERAIKVVPVLRQIFNLGSS
jgi:hypothetical protein